MVSHPYVLRTILSLGPRDSPHSPAKVIGLPLPLSGPISID